MTSLILCPGYPVRLRGHDVVAWTWRGSADLISYVGSRCGQAARCFPARLVHGGSLLRGEVFGVGRGDVGPRPWRNRSADRIRAPLPDGRPRHDSGRSLVAARAWSCPVGRGVAPVGFMPQWEEPPLAEHRLGREARSAVSGAALNRLAASLDNLLNLLVRRHDDHPLQIEPRYCLLRQPKVICEHMAWRL
jgi:hypothetical protein